MKKNVIILGVVCLLTSGALMACSGYQLKEKQPATESVTEATGNSEETSALSETKAISGEESKNPQEENTEKPTEETTEQTMQPQEATEEKNGGFTKFTTLDIYQNEVNQDIFKDYDLTMINIWGTFCGPCLKEMPDLAEINEEYKEKGFQVVGVVIDVFNQDGTLSAAQVDTAIEIAEKTGAGYTHLLPSYDLINGKLKDVTAIPETVFVDKDGNMVGKSYLGAKSKKDWTEIIDSLLEEQKE